MDILKLSPVFKDYIWGGTRLKTDFGFKSNLDILAEGWMLSCHKDEMNTIDGGEYDGQTLESVIEKEGKDILIGFNPKFLIDALKVIDDETIHMYLMNPKAPCFIRDDEETYTYLILPVNISQNQAR